MKTNFNQANFQAIIQSYEQKVNKFYEKLDDLEKEHRSHEMYWDSMGKLKNKLTNILCGFETPE